MNTKTFKTIDLKDALVKIQSLQKKAEKLGIIPPEIVDTVEGIHKELDEETGVEISYKYWQVTINFHPIKLSGWEFLAEVHHGENGNGNSFKKINFDVEIPEKYYNTHTNLCEHCGHNRYRVFTYIVRNIETNEFKQVGSACLKDFCGHSFNFINTYLKAVDENFDEGFDVHHSAPSVCRDQFLELVAYTARVHGFVTGKEYYEKNGFAGGTGRQTWNLIFSDKKGVNKEKVNISDDDKLLAKEAVEIIENLKDVERNNFQQSLYAAGSVGYLDHDQAGVVAYSIKMAIQAREDKNSVDVSNSQFIGKVGDKGVHFNVLVIGKQNMGEYYLIKMATKEGNSLVWFGSFGSFADNLEPGNWYKIKGNIMKHNNFRGINSTQINRVKEI